MCRTPRRAYQTIQRYNIVPRQKGTEKNTAEKTQTYVHNQIFGLANVACKNDHVIILDNTCMPSLVEGINTIEESEILFLYASEDYDKDTNILILNLTPRHRHVSTF